MLRILFYGFFSLLLTACSSNIGPLVSKKIDFETVLPLAQRSFDIYTLKDKELKSLYPQVTTIETIGSIDMRYMIETDKAKQLQIVTLRGTANLENAKQDATYIPSNNSKLGIYVHKGFDDDATLVYKKIKPLLNPNYKIQVTGHSLGASVAALVMIYMYEDGFTLDKTVNFGQPKFTNANGVKKYNFLPLVRFVDANDLVPLVPPITLLDSLHGVYEHLSPEVILLDGAYYCYLNKHQSSKVSIGSFWDNLGNISVAAHGMEHYIANIKSKFHQSIQAPYDKREDYISSKGF